jgi:hypothetical protein
MAREGRWSLSSPSLASLQDHCLVQELKQRIEAVVKEKSGPGSLPSPEELLESPSLAALKEEWLDEVR